MTINLDETQIKNNGFNTPQIDILATRVTAVGDKVVDIPGFDEAVESVVVKFRCGKMIEMPTSIIKTNEYNIWQMCSIGVLYMSHSNLSNVKL